MKKNWSASVSIIGLPILTILPKTLLPFLFNTTACFGDAGGPLFDNVNPVELIGVVTGANGGCADNKVEDVYADVAAFKAWIDGELEDETCDDECVGCLCDAYDYISAFATTLSTTVRGFFDF